MHKAMPLATALKDATLPVGVMLPVLSSTVPSTMRYAPWQGRLSSAWTEMGCTMGSEWCVFGCKLYARQQGCTIRYAVHHSLTYGHSHSPSAR